MGRSNQSILFLSLIHIWYLSRSLPFPIDTIPRWGTKGTARDAIRQIPFMQEMNQEIMKVTDLHGIFRVTIDGIEIGCWSGDELSKGVNLAEISCTPQYQQSLSIMYLNEERCAIEKRLRQYMACLLYTSWRKDAWHQRGQEKSRSFFKSGS